MISVKQAQALRLQCTKSLGMTEGEYKAVLGDYGVKSSKQLGARQYNALMAQLKGGKVVRKPALSPQLRYALARWNDLHRLGAIQHNTPEAMFSWMRKYLRLGDDVVSIEPWRIAKCIEQLKAMIAERTR